MAFAPALAAAALLACLPEGGARGTAGQIVGQRAAEEPVPQVPDRWAGKTCPDLHREYRNIFLHGNRNAASHLWSWFLLERSSQMSHQQLLFVLLCMFSCFCAVSGSPTRPGDFNRYKLTLQRASGHGSVAGFMHYCCWPCVCDTQDFIKVDTKTVVTLRAPVPTTSRCWETPASTRRSWASLSRTPSGAARPRWPGMPPRSDATAMVRCTRHP
ncbi:unnamed protein product [Prorocentrum cordatum]|uniref:Uncharacterized protein n=1 Tax=Prorocentrum cordatum TaxID=2364126 RepID=A0ABN9TPT2_9DINO|nr:unnamed protein product [Polarella glacialis]